MRQTSLSEGDELPLKFVPRKPQRVHEACELYNAALRERRDAWKVCRKSINYYDQANQLKPMREEG